MIGFHIGKTVWKKPHVMYDYNIRPITNYITEQFKVKIIKYAEHIHDMFKLENILVTYIN